MQWQDQGVVLSVRRHGENSAIAEIMTAQNGRALGLVRNGRSRRMRPVLQPGNRVNVTWRARLEVHLGQFSIEPLEMRAARVMDDRLALAGLNTITGLCRLLAEGEVHERLYQALIVVLAQLEDRETWPLLLVRWEVGLLEELGFGLDLRRCAATGKADDLVYVSPKSGGAVSHEAGLPYHDKLLTLPGFLIGQAGFDREDVVAGLALTGYFLKRHVYEPRNLTMPDQRQWLINNL